MNKTRRSVERVAFSLVSGLRSAPRLSQITACNATHSSSVQLGGGMLINIHIGWVRVSRRLRMLCHLWRTKFIYEMERQEPFLLSRTLAFVVSVLCFVRNTCNMLSSNPISRELIVRHVPYLPRRKAAWYWVVSTYGNPRAGLHLCIEGTLRWIIGLSYGCLRACLIPHVPAGHQKTFVEEVRPQGRSADCSWWQNNKSVGCLGPAFDIECASFFVYSLVYEAVCVSICGNGQSSAPLMLM